MSPRKILLPCALLLLSLGTSAVAAATFSYELGIGFTDATAIAPTPGNPATTVGEARANVLMEAGRVWGLLLTSDVPITVSASFEALPCSTNSGAIAGASVSSGVSSNVFPIQNAFYPPALANALFGSDTDSANPDMTVMVNSNLGQVNCLTGVEYYYGFDHNEGPNQIDLLATLLHEFGHGLGFSASVGFNVQTGAGSTSPFDGVERFPIYLFSTYDESLDQTLPLLTGPQRVQALTRTGQLAWSGSQVNSKLSRLTAGTSPAERLLLFAPAQFQQGSSLVHWDIGAAPDLLMEPFITPGLTSFTDLTACALKDIGWQVSRCPDDALNAAPVVPAQTMIVQEDTPALFDVMVNDADGDPGSCTMATLPTRGTLTKVVAANAGCRFRYTPFFNVNGTDSFTVRATQGELQSAPGTITLNIRPINDDPSVSSASFVVESGQSISLSLPATDVDGDTLTFSIVTPPGAGTLSGTGPSFTYRANSGISGTDSFSYSVSDGSVSVSATVTINITAAPPPPQVQPEIPPPNPISPTSPMPMAPRRRGGGGGVFEVPLLLGLLGMYFLRRIRRAKLPSSSIAPSVVSQPPPTA